MKPVFYARVSRDDLFCENQEQSLIAWAERNGLNKEQFQMVYRKEEMTTRKTRPIKEGILLDFRKGMFDTIVVVKIDRWARSLQELIMDVEGIVQNNGRFIAISNGFDFQKEQYNASQQLMLNIFGAFAQFEREMIRERTIEGLMRVKAQGKVLGRPRKTPPANLYQNDIPPPVI